ncbi:MAG: T9SS type A sorting domain-containing protein [Prolixibacteraceae bacterium]
MSRTTYLLFMLMLGISFPIFGQLSDGGFPMEIVALKNRTLQEKIVRMPSFNIEQERKASAAMNQEKSVKFAHSFNVSLSTENSGEWFTMNDYRIWQLKVSSENALSIGLIFTKYHLPEGARLFIYHPDQEEIYGAFTAQNNKSFQKLAIYPYPSDEVIIQYEEPIDVDFHGELELGRINHDYLGVVLKNRWKQRPSGDCNVDVNCETSSGLDLQKRAVCRILADDELGTATLINNTLEDGKPLVISAFHVFDSIQNAEITVFDFNYESPFCIDIDGFDLQTISGAKAIASFDSLDFMLVELSEMPPASYRPYYAGWDATGTRPSNSYTIHHPNGDVKKISHDEGLCDTISFAKNFVKYAHWKVLNWETGTTESGSSGSPLFSNKRVFGTLSGGAASCTNISYDAFGRLNKMWNYRSETEHQLSYWLDPTGKGTKQLDGFDPYVSESTTCTMISNFMLDDQLSTFKEQVSNHLISGVAERFKQTSDATIAGVALGIKDFKTTTIDPQLTIVIYSGSEFPERAEKQYKFSMSKLTSHAMNYFSFGDGYEMIGNFFIAVQLDSRDSITFYQSTPRSFVGASTMLVQENGTWNYFSDYSTLGLGASVLMEVNVCGVSFTQAIDTIDEPQFMKYYPNPASSYLVLEFLNRDAVNELSICDLTGRLLFSECYQHRNYVELDLRAFSPGIYLLNLQSDQKVETRRFVVR